MGRSCPGRGCALNLIRTSCVVRHSTRDPLPVLKPCQVWSATACLNPPLVRERSLRYLAPLPNRLSLKSKSPKQLRKERKGSAMYAKKEDQNRVPLSAGFLSVLCGTSRPLRNRFSYATTSPPRNVSLPPPIQNCGPIVLTVCFQFKSTDRLLQVRRQVQWILQKPFQGFAGILRLGAILLKPLWKLFQFRPNFLRIVRNVHFWPNFLST